MLGITYEIWHSICQMYSKIEKKYYKAYIQWFPFSLFNETDWSLLSSQEFFETYIQNGAFVFFPQLMHQSENYLSKSDGSFRDASLISPLLYLVLQCIGKQISDHYISQRPSEISVYYAGNYQNNRPYYKKDYDDFYKEINAAREDYQYFIKTDITDFFANINVDILIGRINDRCNSKDVVFSQTQLLIYKEFLAYCGNGRFPLIENSIASSYLSTIVYLDSIDCQIYQYISEKINCFSCFKMFRYVDDLYILFSSDKSQQQILSTVNEIRNEYSSILKEFRLSLNSKKFCFKPTSNINEELKKSLYDEYVNGVDFSIEEIAQPSIEKFLEYLADLIVAGDLDVEKYNKCISDAFSVSELEYTPNEILNYCIYNSKFSLQNPVLIQKIRSMLSYDISFIALDPKRLTVMIMKTKDAETIKALLNHLFTRNKNNTWNRYHTIIAVVYFIQSFFRHIDLLKILQIRCSELYSFYQYNCKQQFLKILIQDTNIYCQSVFKDLKSCLFYFMYLVELKKHNTITAFSYFKNFFDRITAILAFKSGKERQKVKKPAFGSYYRLNDAKYIYSQITGSQKILKDAWTLRNSNPLAHSSAELWDNDSSKKEIVRIIERLKQLIRAFIHHTPPK